MSMLEHQKKILLGLQNNQELFQKELFKSIKWLSPKEVGELLEWVKENFQVLYNSTVKDFLSEDQYPIY